MGERRRKLIQNYEDAKLALLLDEYAEVYGKVSTEQYEKDLADGKIIIISDQEADAQLNAILQRAEEEEAKESRISTRFKGVAQKIATVAASIAIFFALMVTVQATGIDVFGAVGRWTDSLFYFESGYDSVEKPKEKQFLPAEIIKDSLLSYRLPSELVPSWFPDGFDISEINFSATEDTQIVDVLLKSKSGDWIILRIDYFLHDQGSNNLWHQKDSGEAEIVEVNQFTFYLAQNNGIWEAMEFSNNCAISIIDSQGKESLLQIIQSYGG